MDVHNKTNRPLTVPLPGGKKLHLAPGGTGQIAPKALEHPPLKALIEAGTLEVVEGKRSGHGEGGGAGKGPGSTKGHRPGGGIQHRGDR